MKSCYRLAICALLFFCTTGKSFTENDYVSFISEAFETSGMGIEACLAKIVEENECYAGNPKIVLLYAWFYAEIKYNLLIYR